MRVPFSLHSASMNDVLSNAVPTRSSHSQNPSPVLRCPDYALPFPRRCLCTNPIARSSSTASINWMTMCSAIIGSNWLTSTLAQSSRSLSRAHRRTSYGPIPAVCAKSTTAARNVPAGCHTNGGSRLYQGSWIVGSIPAARYLK
jgi:hypothetical protein